MTPGCRAQHTFVAGSRCAKPGARLLSRMLENPGRMDAHARDLEDRLPRLGDHSDIVTRGGELRMVWDSVAWLLRWMVGWVSDMIFEKSGF